MIEYMTLYLVILLIRYFFPARLAMISYGFNLNITKLLANLIQSRLSFIIIPIGMHNFV